MTHNQGFYDLVDKAVEVATDPGTIGLLRAARHHESVQTGSDSEIANALRNAKQDDRPPRGFWASGDYVRSCIRCKAMFIGDKRAGHCADCAYADAPPCGCDDPETCEDRDESCPPKKGEAQT
jgi:hypothetical protein